MSDYIDILLSALEEEMYSHLGKDYFLASQREDQAADALRATLSADQNDLFDAYEIRPERHRRRLSGRLRPPGLPPGQGRLPLDRLAVQRPGVAAGDRSRR